MDYGHRVIEYPAIEQFIVLGASCVGAEVPGDLFQRLNNLFSPYTPARVGAHFRQQHRINFVERALITNTHY